MQQKIFTLIVILLALKSTAQVKWINVDADFAPLPTGFHVYKTTDSLDGKPFIAYYAEATLKNKELNFTTDTTYKRRLIPTQFFTKNEQPLLVVNTTFFSFATNQNLNVVIKEGSLVSYSVKSTKGKGSYAKEYVYPMSSAIGIDSKRNPDVAWLYADSSKHYPIAFQLPLAEIYHRKDSTHKLKYKEAKKIKARIFDVIFAMPVDRKWKMETAVGGGPVLLQGGIQMITNEEELKFSGKNGLTDKHPRTAMGYTADGRLIIMVIQGRSADAAGATLVQEAQLFKDLGCVEALNLDGGGSSCMLINGKQTIKVSDATGERPVPAVFIVKAKK